MKKLGNSQYLPTEEELIAIIPPGFLRKQISIEKDIYDDECGSQFIHRSRITGWFVKPDKPQKDKSRRKINVPPVSLDISVTIFSRESLPPVSSKYLIDVLKNSGQYTSVNEVNFGDGGLICGSKWDGFVSISLTFDYGNYYVVVSTGGERRGRSAMVKKIAQIVEDKLQAKVFLLKPIQALDNASVPLISGKKMAVFVGLEYNKTLLETKGYFLRLQGKKGQFRQNEYSIEIGKEKSRPFGKELENVDDGANWNKEIVELLEGKEAKNCLERFAIKDKPKKGCERRIYRFMLAPPGPNLKGICQFRASFIHGDKRILSSHFVSPQTVPSPRKKIAIIPLRIGYWAPPQYWLAMIREHGIKSFNDFKWQLDYRPDGFSLAWRAGKQIREEFLEAVKNNVLPSQADRDTWGKLDEKSKDLVKKAVTEGSGQQAYQQLARAIVYYTKAVFPAAEQCLEFTIKDDQPWTIDSPDPGTWRNNKKKPDIMEMLGLPMESTKDIRELVIPLDGVRNKLTEFLHVHTQYDRVLAIIPGGSPGDGGVNLDIRTIVHFIMKLKNKIMRKDSDSVSLGLTFRNKNRRISLLAVDSIILRSNALHHIAEWGAHELAHTFGAQDEYLTLLGPVQRLRIENPIQPANKVHVSGGFWAALKAFQGSAKQPVYSLMNAPEDIFQKRWISPELYKGLIDNLSKGTKMGTKKGTRVGTGQKNK